MTHDLLAKAEALIGFGVAVREVAARLKTSKAALHEARKSAGTTAAGPAGFVDRFLSEG